MVNPFKTFWDWISCKIIYINQELEEQIVLKDEEISKLNVVIERLKIRKDLSFPSSYNTIDIYKTLSLLGEHCPDVYISDMSFDLTTQEEAAKFSEETAVQYRTWVSEKHDCDNFSFASMGYWSDGLKSFAYGIAWSTNHAYNIMIDKDKNVWIIEPQSNKWYTLDYIKENPKIGELIYYPMRMIVM